MKQNPRQPQSADLQALQTLLQSGLMAQTEAKARNLLKRYPNALSLLNFLALSQQTQGKIQAAIASFRHMLLIEPRIAEIHFNLGVLLTQLNDITAAVASYRQAVQLKPTFTAAHFNLGALYQAQGLLTDAATHYQQAIRQEPTYAEALANLGTVLQQQGQMLNAEQYYRQALALKPDARGFFNLGTVLHDQGKHIEAMQAFREALKLDAELVDAWNDLGETLRDHGDMDEAVRCYHQALAVQPNHARAQYNLGEFFCSAGRLLEAITYFERSDFADARERALQCYYKTRQFEVFKQKFDQHTAQNPHTSVLLGALSSHYAHNFGIDNTYRFCKAPMEYILHTRIEALAMPGSPLLKTLLHDIQHIAIAERKQGRLYYGKQSAGNLLLRAESSLQQLAGLIREQVRAYQQHFSNRTDEIINSFPPAIEFTSSWYLRMQQGGYLTSHIHEEGWISGCVYLALPAKQEAHEGSFAYSTHGDDYPCLQDNFPNAIVDQQIGDLVLFPSSLFHRTIPFHADQERVCVAFDVKPR